LVTDDQRLAVGGNAVIVVDPGRGQVDRQLREPTAPHRQAIEPAFAVDEEVAAVTRPVGRLEAAIRSVDGLDVTRGDVDGLQKASDSRILRQEDADEEKRS